MNYKLQHGKHYHRGPFKSLFVISRLFVCFENENTHLFWFHFSKNFHSTNIILTSATPHDGTRESYASLMDLLDPTLVVDPNDITKESLNDSGAIIRRFRSSPGKIRY